MDDAVRTNNGIVRCLPGLLNVQQKVLGVMGGWDGVGGLNSLQECLLSSWVSRTSEKEVYVIGIRIGSFFPPLFSAFLKQYGSCGLLFPPFVCFCFFLRESKASLPPPFPRTLCLCAQSLWCCRLADAPLTLSLCPFSAEMLKITLLTDVPFAIERGGCVKKEKKKKKAPAFVGQLWRLVLFTKAFVTFFFFFLFGVHHAYPTGLP